MHFYEVHIYTYTQRKPIKQGTQSFNFLYVWSLSAPLSQLCAVLAFPCSLQHYIHNSQDNVASPVSFISGWMSKLLFFWHLSWPQKGLWILCPWSAPLIVSDMCSYIYIMWLYFPNEDNWLDKIVVILWNWRQLRNIISLRDTGFGEQFDVL